MSMEISQLSDKFWSLMIYNYMQQNDYKKLVLEIYLLMSLGISVNALTKKNIHEAHVKGKEIDPRPYFCLTMLRFQSFSNPLPTLNKS